MVDSDADPVHPEPLPSPRRANLLWPSSTYFAEGLPWSLLHQVAAEFFTALGAPPSAVGRTSLLHGPMLLKALFSPVVESFGTLRAWMVSTQAAMGVLVGWLALLADGVMRSALPSSADTTLIWGVLLVIGLCSAVHDIACDGFYMEALDETAQARFSGLRVAAFRFAMMVGSSGLVFLAGLSNWFWGFGCGAALLGVLALGHHVFLPRTSRRVHAERARRVRAAWGAYTSFFKQDAVVLVVGFLLAYKMADVLMFSMSKVLLGRDLGIGTELRGIIGFFSVGASIVGAIVGGAWVARVGLGRALFPITLLMALTEPLYAVMASFSPMLSLAEGDTAATLSSIRFDRSGFSFGLVTAVVVVEQVCGGLATAAQVVFIMRRCDPDHRTTHYAFATVIYSLAHIALGTLSGYAFETLGAPKYFWAVSFLALPAVVLARLVPHEQRRAHSAASA